MPRNSFLIEDILDKNETNNTSNITNNDVMHPFKKRSFTTMNESTDSSSAATSTRVKHFKYDDCLSPASSVSYTSDCMDFNATQAYLSSFYEQNQDMLLNSLISNAHDSQQQQQLLASYYAVLAQFQDDYLSKRFKQQQSQTTDYNQQINQFLITKLFQQQQQSKHVNSNIKQKPVKLGDSIENSKLLQKPKLNSISSSPASSSSSSSSSDVYNSSSNNLSPQSNDDCSSTSCIENVSPLDALLQLANSTFINKNNQITSNNDTCLMDQDQANNFKKLFQQNGAYIDETILLNNDLLLQQQQQLQIQQNKSSLNNSFESNTSSVTTTQSQTKSNILLNGINANTNTKRKRKNRTAFTAVQIVELEKRFTNQRYLSPHDRDRIAYELQLSTAQVITWFQNRRAKQKRELEDFKNDVNAAKNCRVLDPNLDVEKVLRLHKFNSEIDLTSTKMDFNNTNKANINDNDDDNVTNTDYDDDDDDDDNQSVNASLNGGSSSSSITSTNISNENLTNK